MRRVLLVLALAMLAALALALATQLTPSGQEEITPEQSIALPESPMPGRLLIGFQDDGSLRWADDRAEMLDRARESGTAIIRTIVVWERTAPHRPSDPADPFEASYRLDDVDELARGAQERGIELLISIWGTPPWANGGQGPKPGAG